MEMYCDSLGGVNPKVPLGEKSLDGLDIIAQCGFYLVFVVGSVCNGQVICIAKFR